MTFAFVSAVVEQRAAEAATIPAGFFDQTVASGLNLPTSLGFVPDGRILVAEKSGLIKVVKNGQLLSTPFADLRSEVNDYWDRGLGGLAVHPNFVTNKFIYVFYPHDPDGTDGSGPVTNRLVRLTAQGDVMSPGSATVILGSVTGAGCGGSGPNPDCLPQDWYGHGADTLRFASDGTLFVSLGDAASWTFVDDRALRAQDVDEYPGKVLRITTNGDGLPTNPFWNGDPDAIRSKVWAYGFRNPFRMSLRPQSDLPFVGDVGWDDVEEIDVATAGANFGWPCYEGNDHQPGFESKPTCQVLYNQGPSAVKAPLITWDHGSAGAAAVGGPFTPANSPFPASYDDGFFYADYAQNWIRFAKVNPQNQLVGNPQNFATNTDGPVDLQFAPDGTLYYVAIYTGAVHRVGYLPPGVTYLSDLSPTGVPINGWGPYERDKSNGEQAAGDGNTLTINGATFGKGLGTHAASELRYTLPAECTSFTAQIGVDDEMPASSSASVVFEVWDGTATRLDQSPVKTAADPATSVTVGLTGVAILRLVVTGGGNGIASDHADWADAKLVCGNSAYVSDLTPTGTPINGWGPYERDRSNGEQAAGDGDTLTIEGATFAKGLGTHAASDLRYTLPAGCTSFRAQVGVDDEMPATSPASVVFEVWNGTTSRLYESPLKAAADPATPVIVGLSGVTTLRLVVTGGGNGMAADHSDWADAKLICESGDVTPPVISGISSNPGVSDAAISWTTDEPADSQVSYGTTTSYGSSTVLDPTQETSHLQNISGLAPGTTYHYQVRSRDAAGNLAVGPDRTFTTSAAPTTYLSDLTPTGTPVNGWGPYERDKSNGEKPAGDGRTLTINGATFGKGLGTHAVSDLRYTVPAECSSFSAQVGADDEMPTSSAASVVFEVWNGTTTRLYASPLKTAADPATPVTVGLSGVTTLRLVVTGGGNGIASDHADWADAQLICDTGNNPPIATVESPLPGTEFKVGDQIDLSGHAVDVEDGSIPSSGLSWQVDIHHCPGGTCHVHPFTSFTGPTAAFAAPDHGDDSHLEVTLTATDSGGATDSVDRDVDPETITLVLDSVPSGRQLRYGGAAVTAPFQTTASVGGVRSIEAVTPQGQHTFSSWSDGGAAQHNITVPENNTTITATFVAGSYSYLSDLTPTGVPVNGWGPYERDKSNGERAAGDGTTLKINGATFAKGLGTHAVSDLRYSVPAGCTSFTSQVGVDDEMPPSSQASVVFEVWDGTATRLYESPLKTAVDPATPLNVDLSGVTTLRLVVTNGGNGNASDHSDWAEAGFVCGSVSPLFGPAASYPAGTNTHSVVTVDVNGDTLTDLVTANAGDDTVSVLIGNGDGTFDSAAAYGTGSEPKSVATGDLDGDGDSDLVTANQGDDTVSVLLGNGLGAFAAKVDYAGAAGSHEAAIGDLNGDTFPDVAVVGHGGNVLSVLVGNGTGTLAAKVDYAVGAVPNSVALGDLNGDGRRDVVTTNHGSASVSVLLGNSGGTLEPAVSYAVGSGPHSVRLADLNGDAELDVVTANDTSDNASVLLGQGDGTFAAKVDYATGTTPKGVSLADIDGDGDVDILTANIRGNYPTLVNPGGDSVSVLRGNGNGTFQPKVDYTVGQAPFSVATGLIDADTKLDIATANWHDNGVTVRLNTGS